MQSIPTTFSPLLVFVSISCTETTAVDSGTSANDTEQSTDDSGSDSDDPTDTDPDDSGSDVLPAEDYRNPGPYSVQSSTGQESADSCEMDFTLYTPVGLTDAPLVLLAHGFVRSRANMVGWAEHFASWGLQVATPDLCHASIWDTDHSANADDLIALGQNLSSDSVIYAGQSAGGLAATLAVGRDPSSLGALGLDATDSESLGAGEASQITSAVYGLAGEPSDCNANSNGLSIYSAISQAHVLRVTEADHCDFESDTDALCTAFCQGSNNQFTDDQIHQAILGLSTAALLDMTGQSQAGVAWWSEEGEYYGELQTSGIISVP